ncbi:unnamed protein product [Larinioides sclopetarius]|uniref:Uncharacterized protein n=1 Tax=Larinioides sclopetarius TaxID=280406 RepID=A0AAV1ZLV0_9ARAC
MQPQTYEIRGVCGGRMSL